MNLRNLRTAVSVLVRGGESATLEQRNARNLIASGAFLGFIDGGIVTYLPVWLARLGASPALLGLLASGPPLVNILTLPLAGAYVERQGDLVRLANRAAILHRFGFLVIAALPLLSYTEQIPIAAVIVWSAITIPAAIHLPAFLSVIQRSVPPPMRPTVNGARWALWTMVGAILIPVCGLVTDGAPFPLGYQLVFVLSFIGTLPNLYFFGRIEMPPLRESRAQTVVPQSVSTRLRQFIQPFFDSRRFVRFNLATAAFRVCLSMPAGLFSIFWVDYL